MSNVTFVAEWMNTVNTKYIQKVPRSVEQRTVIKFLVGENVPSAEIHHRLQQQYGEECLRRRSTIKGTNNLVIFSNFAFQELRKTEVAFFQQYVTPHHTLETLFIQHYMRSLLVVA